MKKTFFVFALLCLVLSSAFSFDLIVPSPGEDTYVLMNEDDEIVVDDSVFYKSGLDRLVQVERFSDTITLIKYEHDEELLVLLNTTADEMESQRFSIRFSVDEPDVLLVNTPVDFDFLDEIDADDIYISGRITGEERAMLRRLDTDFVELDPSSILNITRDGIRIISGSRYPSNPSGGIYVKCPNCGTMIYVPQN